jgi:hypothetical protein
MSDFFFVVLTKIDRYIYKDNIEMTGMQPINSGRNRQETQQTKTRTQKQNEKNRGEHYC